MEDGRRLENLSWRVWNRELLCCEPQPELATTPAMDITRSKPVASDIPELSTSVDSAISGASDRIESFQHTSTRPVAIAVGAHNDTDSIQCVSRGKEKHITSTDLEKMVSSIQEQDEPWPLPQSITDAIPTISTCANITDRPTSPSLYTSIHSSESSASTAPRSSPESDRSIVETAGSDTSAEFLSSSHSVVRGFSLNVSSSYRSNTHLAAPTPSAVPIQHKKINDTKPKVAFSLGGGSSGDEGSSFEERMSSQHPRQSSLTARLQNPPQLKKQTSFKDELQSRAQSHLNEDVFEDSDEEDDQESAIEDDDDADEDEDGSDWEDDGSESGEAVDEKQLFKRIDSKPTLVSRRSLLTTLMNEPDRAAAFQNMASQSTPALKRAKRSSLNGPSLGNTAREDPVALPPTMTQSKPIIMTTSNTHPPALSPRTTRRNMLASEMTESLRKHLLWERQQISTTAKAVLKRRHTAFDVTKLSEYPNEKDGQSSKNNSWNHFYDQGNAYNEAGW